MKICVYAICKNESKFIDRWMKSIANEADYIAVLDTGSTDDSFNKLCTYSDNSLFCDIPPYKAKIYVDSIDIQAELGIMRFDAARNQSLKLVPIDADICVVLDLDQVPVKGWSDIIKERFEQGYTEVHGDIVDHDANGLELNRWRSRNVHPNSPFWIWERVIHEGIEYYGKEENKIIYDNRFIINHYPDYNKDRSLYKELLYYSCKKYPKDPYYGIYLGIELSRRGTKQESAEAFRRCLNECDFSKDTALKYQTYLNLALVTDNDIEAHNMLNLAEELGIKTRRLYNIRADIYERQGNNDAAISSLEQALEIESYSSDWKDDRALYSGNIEDRLSLFYYYTKKDYLKSIEYCVKALQLSPDNNRLITNLKYYYNSFLESRRTNDGK